MKKIIAIFTIFTLIFPVSFNAIAINEAECSIWLCLPAGFPNGCSDAKSAVKKRIKKGKTPLPAFPSCSVETGVAGESEISAYQGAETRIKPHEECVKYHKKWISRNQGTYKWVCDEYKKIEEYFVLGRKCPLPKEPFDYRKYCEVRNMVQVYENEKPLGEKFYW